jgi:GT2 family glycosyltransferase/SAM-dependent methyltransferase
MHLVDIVIPTYNNYEYLSSCLGSLTRHNSTHGLFKITVINNGHKDSCNWIQHPDVTVLQPGKNLGWEGGIKLGLETTKAPFVLFLNDDTFVPVSSQLWLNQLLNHFTDPGVGAVGCASNVVMGLQNIFTFVPYHIFERKFLIGFCFLTRREAIEKAGGIDDTCPASDDFDMSIRIRKAGYKLLVDRSVFIYHHGFKTGARLHGNEQQRNGWNSFEMMEKGNHFIIKKHGFREWVETMKDSYEIPQLPPRSKWEDTEGECIRKVIGSPENQVILDLGCGNNKTLPEAVGMDMIRKNEVIDSLNGNPTSAADINADVSQPLPVEDGSVDVIVARHILEHLMDTTLVIQQWIKALKVGGKLIIAVPNNGRILSIPMNYEHCHGWNPEALRHLLEVLGVKVVEQIDPENGISFITVGEKI